MDLIFNELSLYDKAANKFDALNLMKNLLFTCKEANNYDFKFLRVNNSFTQLLLFENYTINNWLNDQSVRKDYKALLLGLRRYPFINEDDENIEDSFIKKYYYLNLPERKELHMKESEGLAVAFLYDTLSISFATNKIWEKISIELLEKTDKEEKSVSVRHISFPDHIKLHIDWIELTYPKELIKIDIHPEMKMIHLRDDHGRDILKKFAKKLIYSPYIVKIINSLPFNPGERDFIKRTDPDWKIEIVLIKTNEGFGLIVQTTGRNLQETTKIANIIEQKYSEYY